MDIVKLAKDNIEALKSPEGWLYASLGRYACFFGRDSATVSLELLDIYPDIAKSTLIHLADTQGKTINIKREEEVGKIVHEDRIIHDGNYDNLLKLGYEFPYYGSADSTFLFVLLAERYFQKTKDKETISKIGKNLSLSLIWIKDQIDDDYLVRVRTLNTNDEVYNLNINRNWIDNPKALFYKNGDLPNEDKTNYPVAHLDVQSLLYALVEDIDVLVPFLEIDAFKTVKFLKENNYRIKENLDKLYFMPEEKYFAPALDKKNRQFDIVTSVPGFVLYSKLASEKDAEMIVKRMFKDDMNTSYGIRVLPTKEKLFSLKSYQHGAVWPQDNWMIYEGLKNYGYFDECNKIKEEMVKAVNVLGVIPELFNVDLEDNLINSEEDIEVDVISGNMKVKAMGVQAWACGAMLSILEDSTFMGRVAIQKTKADINELV